MNRHLLGILLVWSGTCFLASGQRGFWSPDEPRHMEVVREILSDGHCLILQLDGQPYPDKPPLFFWLCALSAKIGGFSPFLLRLPTCLSALVCALFLYGLGSRLYERRTGFVASILLLTTGEFLWLSQRADMNVLLLACMLGAIWAGVGERWGLCYLSLGFGILVKGPVGFIIPWLVLAASRFASEGIRGCLKLGWKWLPVAMIPPVSWIGLLLGVEGAAGREYLLDMIFGHGVAMAAQTESHFQSWFYYLKNYPPTALPWILLLPTGLWISWRRRAWLPLLWFCLPFVFFSIVSAKRSLYLLPITPALALMCGLAVTAVEEKWAWVRWPLVLVGGMIGVGGLGGMAIGEGEWLDVRYPLWIAGGLVSAMGFVSIHSALRGNCVSAVAWGAGGIAAVSLVFRIFVAPQLDLALSMRKVADALRAMGAENKRVISCEVEPSALNLALGRVTELRPKVPLLASVWDSSEEVFVVARDFGKGKDVKDVWAGVAHGRGVFGVGHREYGVYSNREGSVIRDEGEDLRTKGKREISNYPVTLSFFAVFLLAGGGVFWFRSRR